MILFWIFKEINTFIQHVCIKMIKNDNEDIYNVEHFQINAVLLNFLKESILLSKIPGQRVTWFTQKH